METYEPEIPFPESNPLPQSTPVVPLQKKKSRIGYIIIGIFIGIIIAITFVQLELSSQWVTQQTYNDQAVVYYNAGVQEGIIYVANYTTLTGNFTYIENDSIRTQGVQELCVDMIQQINQGGNK